ncbi:DUF4123 domain-containing protein [Duganella sp. CF517]|uniref:DUF4123 domain-containing protein n=1 Tax=Duganella sp. CF517 TaxID=1881038 RepID=UPI0011607D68|nr:DUF4123 domain-containing protein [Duganella sp. CF517]
MEEHKLSSRSADELLYNFGRDHKRTILLIDRFIDNPLHELLESSTPVAKSLPVDDPIFEDNLARAALLVELRHEIPSHAEILQESIRLASAQSYWTGAPRICAWIFTPVTLDQIRKEIRSNLNVRYPDGQQYYFRFFDPRVMPHLVRILTDSQNGNVQGGFCKLLGSIQTWCHLDFEGKMVSYNNANTKAALTQKVFDLDQRTAAAVDRIAVLNLTIKKLAQMEIKYEHSHGSLIDEEILYAEHLGVREAEDKVASAWRTFSKGRTFFDEKDLKDLIDNAQAEGIPLESLLSAYIK